MKNRLKVGDIIIAVDDVGYEDDPKVIFIRKNKSYAVTKIDIQERDVYGEIVDKRFEFEIIDEQGKEHTFYYESLNRYDSDYFFDTFMAHRVKKIKSILE